MINELSDSFLDAIKLMMNDNEEETKEIVTNLLFLTNDNSTKNVFQNDEVILILKSLTEELLNTKDSTSKSEQAEVLIKFATNKTLNNNAAIKTAIEALFMEQKPMTSVAKKQIKTRLKNRIVWHMTNALNKDIYKGLNKAASTADEDQQSYHLSNVLDIARAMLSSDMKKINQPSSTVIERIDMTNIETITPAIAKFNLTEKQNVLKTGLVGLNMMCGRRGGFALGESISINALSHNYKTGLLMKIADSIVKCNTPSPELGGGVPVILYLSLENEANKNMMSWYRQNYAYKYGKYPPADMKDEDIAKFIVDDYSDFGYRLMIERHNGTNYGFDEYCQTIEEYEAMGCRVVCSTIDYMNQMKKISKLSGSLSNKQNHLLLRDLYTNMCNFNRTMAITQVSAHQLNRDASNIAHSGRQNIVKMFGGNVMADGMDVQREIDMEIYIHLEYDQYDRRYLTMQRGKHRYVDDTPVAHQYCAYQFGDFGIPSDFFEPKPKFVRDIYSVEAPEGYQSSSDDMTENTADNLF